jgi:hypothetical protein
MMRVKDPALVQTLLAERGLSMAEVGKRLDRSKTWVHQVVHGTQRVDEIDARVLARMVGRPVGSLFVIARAPSRERRYQQSA